MNQCANELTVLTFYVLRITFHVINRCKLALLIITYNGANYAFWNERNIFAEQYG